MKESHSKDASVSVYYIELSCCIWRLVKGDGEILEEIVTKERHKQIKQVGFIITYLVSFLLDTSYETSCSWVVHMLWLGAVI